MTITIIRRPAVLAQIAQDLKVFNPVDGPEGSFFGKQMAPEDQTVTMAEILASAPSQAQIVNTLVEDMQAPAAAFAKAINESKSHKLPALPEFPDTYTILDALQDFGKRKYHPRILKLVGIMNKNIWTVKGFDLETRRTRLENAEGLRLEKAIISEREVLLYKPEWT